MKHPPQEHDLVPGRKIIGVGIGVIVATVIGVLAAYGIGSCTAERWPSPRTAGITGEIGAMETAVFVEEAQGLEMHQRAEQHLSRYGWVQRDREIVHVPIEVAFELWLQRQQSGRGGAR